MDGKIPYELSDYVLGKYFVETGKNQHWLTENNRPVIVAVSGGGDSVALLWLCVKFYHGRIVALHVNHGIRGSESDEDMNFTRDIAESLNVEFVCISSSVPDEREKGESLEAAARRIRLHSICDLAHELRVDTVFLGHNRDDLAETVLFNMLRGTGIRGSVGITEFSELEGIKFYRPLLGLRRKFLRDILNVRGISWREDSTNNDDRYTRNFIRLKLLPLVEKHINSLATEHLANFGEDMRRTRELEDSMSTRLLNECREKDTHYVTLTRKKLRALDDDAKSLVIREVGRNLGLKTLSRKRCTELARLISKPEKFIFQWCGGVNVVSCDGKIIFEDSRGKNDNAESS